MACHTLHLCSVKCADTAWRPSKNENGDWRERRRSWCERFHCFPWSLTPLCQNFNAKPPKCRTLTWEMFPLHRRLFSVPHAGCWESEIFSWVASGCFLCNWIYVPIFLCKFSIPSFPIAQMFRCAAWNTGKLRFLRFSLRATDRRFRRTDLLVVLSQRPSFCLFVPSPAG